MMRRFFAVAIILIPMILVYVLSMIFVRYGVYDMWYGVSPIMHALGGFVTAWTFWMYVRYSQYGGRKKNEVYPRYLRVCTTLGVVLVIGVVWEWHELFLDAIYSTQHMLGVSDTLIDLSMDALGALVYSYYFTDIDKG